VKDEKHDGRADDAKDTQNGRHQNNEDGQPRAPLRFTLHETPEMLLV
jgi:hypothetical protein